ncbi:MAG: hypothetical protein AAF517_24735, partial [Planctomycetota bacterium]
REDSATFGLDSVAAGGRSVDKQRDRSQVGEWNGSAGGRSCYIEASVTFKIENAHWTEVLEAIAENAGCALVEIEGGYRFTRLQPCSKAYPGTPLRMAFEILAKDLELNLVIPASVSGEITRSLPAQPTLDSVVELAHRHGHRVVLGTDGDLEVFRIVPSEK